MSNEIDIAKAARKADEELIETAIQLGLAKAGNAVLDWLVSNQGALESPQSGSLLKLAEALLQGRLP